MNNQKKSVYPIIPIIIPITTLSNSDDESQSKTSENGGNMSETRMKIIRAMKNETAINQNLPEQTEELLERIQNPQTKLGIRHLKKTSYCYNAVPKKTRMSHDYHIPMSMGSTCGIAHVEQLYVYVVDEEFDTANKCGFQVGDMILDGRTVTESELCKSVKPKLATTQKKTKRKQELDMESNTEIEQDIAEKGAIEFVLPVETHVIANKMLECLSDFIQISLLPLCTISSGRYVDSNSAGGLERCPTWKGVVVTPAIRDALRGPSGAIWMELKKKWGVEVEAMEIDGEVPESVASLGMVLLRRIVW